MIISFIPKNTADQEILADVNAFETALQVIAEHCKKNFLVNFKPEEISLEYEMPFGKYILEPEHGEKVPYTSSSTNLRRNRRR